MRTTLQLILSCFLLVAGTDVCLASQNERPNILLIIADDLGYGDLSCNGNTVVDTPNLDYLASQSVRFENFYVHSVCAPTRASLLTGRHFLRTGISGVHGGRDFLHPDEVTIAEVLQDEGYATGMWGKWHSGKTDAFLPCDRGFEEAYRARLYHYHNNFGWRNGVPEQRKGWITELLTSDALEFIESHQSEPFFAYLPYLTVHGIWQAPEAYSAKYEKMGFSQELSIVNGMIEFMDEQVGRLLRKLDELNLSDNTVVFFLSDNGPVQRVRRLNPLSDEEWKLRNPTGLRGSKGNNWDNGIKSPLFIRFGDRYESASCEQLTDVSDLFPTILELVGKKDYVCQFPLDGQSIVNFLKKPNREMRPKEVYSSRWGPTIDGEITSYGPLSDSIVHSLKYEEQMLALRNQRFKLHLNSDGIKNGESYLLFDMENDPQERTNVIDQYPDVFESMREKLQTWHRNILSEAHSYYTSVYQIGYKQRNDTEIFTYAPAILSKGLECKALTLEGWDQYEEFISFKLNVLTEGTYELKLLFDSSVSQGIEFVFEVGDQQVSCSAVSSNAVRGVVHFPKGEQTLVLKLSKFPEGHPSVTTKEILVRRTE